MHVQSTWSPAHSRGQTSNSKMQEVKNSTVEGIQHFPSCEERPLIVNCASIPMFDVIYQLFR
jgi:hypothetical protein